MNIDFNKVPSYIKREIVAPKKTIVEGQNNTYVKQILGWLNYHDCRTTIDEKFGQATTICVKEFQQMNQKAATGKVDKKT